VLVVSLLSASTPQAQLFERGVAELNAGDYGAAERDFDQVLAAFPNHAGTLQNLGLIYSRTQRFDQAIAMYRRALDLRPGNVALLLNLGIAYIRRESFTEALPVFQKLAPSGSSDPGLLYLLSAGYLRQNPGPAGHRAVETLLNSLPAAPAAFVRCRLEFENGRFEEAAAQCRKALPLPGAHRELGKTLVSQRSPEAEPELAAAIAQDPADSVAVYYYGLALLQDGNATDAAPQFERAIRLDPSFWGSYFYLGKMRLQTKQAGQAVPLLRQAAELNPAASAVFYELGRALLATGETAEAEKAMQRVRDLRAQELERDVQSLRKK